MTTRNLFNATAAQRAVKPLQRNSSTYFSAKCRRLNRLIEMDLCSSTSQRRIAIMPGCVELKPDYG